MRSSHYFRRSNPVGYSKAAMSTLCVSCFAQLKLKMESPDVYTSPTGSQTPYVTCPVCHNENELREVPAPVLRFIVVGILKRDNEGNN